MGKAKVALVALIATLMCLALGGCAGAAGSAQDNFSGSWDLYEMEGENGTDAETVQMMADSGLTISLDLASNGVATLSLFGEESQGQWTPKDATTATIVFDGEEVGMRIVGDKLEMDNQENKMVFQKGSGTAPSSPASSASEGSSSASSSAAQSSAETEQGGQDPSSASSQAA